MALAHENVMLSGTAHLLQRRDHPARLVRGVDQRGQTPLEYITLGWELELQPGNQSNVPLENSEIVEV